MVFLMHLQRNAYMPYLFSVLVFLSLSFPSLEIPVHADGLLLPPMCSFSQITTRKYSRCGLSSNLPVSFSTAAERRADSGASGACARAGGLEPPARLRRTRASQPLQVRRRLPASRPDEGGGALRQPQSQPGHGRVPRDARQEDPAQGSQGVSWDEDVVEDGEEGGER